MSRGIIGIFIVFFIGVLISYGLYQYNRPHEGTATKESSFQLAASTIFNEFETDEVTAGNKYNDKIVAVSGEITDVGIEDDGTVKVTLEAGGMMGGVICQMDSNFEGNFEIGETKTFKGVCTGYLMDVILIRCVEEK